MWIASTAGWFSIVRDRDRTGFVFVRARRREHLDNLLEIFPEGKGHEIETPLNDYPCRLVLPRRKLSMLFDRLEESIVYPNFKAEVGRTGDRDAEECYHEVWSVVRGHLDERLRDAPKPLKNRATRRDRDHAKAGTAL